MISLLALGALIILGLSLTGGPAVANHEFPPISPPYTVLDGPSYTPISGVAVDGSGNLYVAVGNYYGSGNEVKKFDSAGTLMARWGSYGSGPGEFINPAGLAVDPSGNVFVTDQLDVSGNGVRVQKFDSNGTFVTQWGSYGSGPGEFDYAGFSPGLGVDGSGNVYVVDPGNHRVQKFTSNGVFLAEWGSFGSAPGQFEYPEGLAVDGSGHVYVGDGDVVDGRARVQEFDSNGTYVTEWGSYGSGPGQFRGFGGIAVDGSGNVYVVDQGTGRVQKFTSTGTFLTQLSLIHYLFHPLGVAVDGSGNVFVSNNQLGEVYKFAPPTPGGGNVAVTGGETISTDPASPTSPVQTTINVSYAITPGVLTITPQAPGSSPTGFALLGTEIVLEGPEAPSAESPHIVRFMIDASMLGGIDPSTVTVFRNNIAVGPCADQSEDEGPADPDPCIVSAGLVDGGGGDGFFTLRTTAFSTWGFGVGVQFSKDDCKGNGWRSMVDDLGRRFKNQGDCVSFFATKGKNKAKG